MIAFLFAIMMHSTATESEAAMLDLTPAYTIIMRHEGLRLRAYRDPRPGDPLLTIGYGHTGPDVKRGQAITHEQALDLLRLDTISAAHAVRQLVRVPLTRGQFCALVSFTFNVGIGAFARSSVLKALNRGDYVAVQRALLRYVHAGKPPKPLPGLVRRRHDEAALFAATE